MNIFSYLDLGGGHSYTSTYLCWYVGTWNQMKRVTILDIL